MAGTLGAAAASFAVGFAWGVALATFLGLALLALTPVRPGAGLLGAGLLAVLDPFSRSVVFSGGLLPLPWNTAGYALLLVFVLLLPSEGPRLRGLPVVAAALLLGLLLLELIPSVQRLQGVQHVFGLFSFFAFLLIASRAAPDVSAWLWLGRLGGAAGAAFAIAYLLRAASWEAVNKNAWAWVPFTGICLIVPAVLVAGTERGVRTRLTLLAALDLGLVFVSGSRGTFAAALCAFATLVVAGAERGERMRRVLAAFVVAVPLAAGALVVFPAETGAMVDRIARAGDESRSLANRTSGRSDLARIGLEVARANPLGVGTGAFQETAARYGVVENVGLYRGGARALQAHSAWVKTLAENGFPGLLLLALFVGSFAAAGIARRADGVAGAGVLATVVLAIAFVSTEFQAKGMWLFAALVALIVQRGRRRAAAPAPEAVEEEPAWPRVATVR